MVSEPGKGLAALLGDLAIEMQHQPGTEATLRSIVKGAVDLIDGARWAGISMIRGRNVTAEVPTDPVVKELDELQNALGQGPCLTALREQRTIHIPDMTAEHRFPRFARAAADLGVASLLSFQLFVRGENLGALNLYADQRNAFDDDAIVVGGVVAQHASIAMIGVAAERQFDAALASRDIIGQAKGMIMERFDIDAVQAFALLTRLSQSTNTKLVDVAERLVNTDHPRPRRGPWPTS